jgi:predicted pyridoxine 5'-phosphate oxidase superfamily flavin-nucleotide-binding protein
MAPSAGADVSHRGGKPGFVRIEADKDLVFPDFSGNFLFNTIGNILQDPRAGLLFPDFETGRLVYMTGTAEIVWDGPIVAAFDGAQRLIRFRAEEILRVEESLPFKFAFGDFSPALDKTGGWPGEALAK